ncbi:phosphatidate cytidylyltransferase, mitochondrial [Cryptosporidium felis]|nr:phosphatidate cytidylyltransferase, mitochondrial [Cryptosporidium felis]
MAKTMNFNPLRFLDMNNTIAVFKYGSTLRSVSAFNERIHDFIVVIGKGTKTALQWHGNMLTHYPNHYSKIALMWPKAIPRIQRYSKRSPVYYNSCILAEGRKLIKYGVISEDQFIDALMNWNSSFVLNRFQKMIYPIGESGSNLQPLILESRKQIVRLSFLSLCKDSFIKKRLSSTETKIQEKSDFENKTVSLLDVLKRIVYFSYKGDLRFLFWNSFHRVCERELLDSLPFLVADYLPIIIDYIEENNPKLSFEGARWEKISKIYEVAKSISNSLTSKLVKDPFSGMSDELKRSEDWNLFFKLFLAEKIIVTINPTNKWKINEFRKLPTNFTSRASRLTARKRLLRLFPIKIISSNYIKNPSSVSIEPWSTNIIDEVVRNSNFVCSLIGAINNFFSNFGKITFYLKYKLIKFK